MILKLEDGTIPIPDGWEQRYCVKCGVALGRRVYNKRSKEKTKDYNKRKCCYDCVERKAMNAKGRIEKDKDGKLDNLYKKMFTLLKKGHTIHELRKKLQMNFYTVKDYIDDFEPRFRNDGYALISNRNEYNEIIYILLPLPKDDISIKPRDIDLHKADDGSPYLIAQLKDKTDEVRIVPMFDVHYGHHAHKETKFQSTLEWIKNTDGVYVILGGDLMENALDDNRGMSYEQTKNPSTQLNEMVKCLAPIAHKIIGCTPGNHELRTERRAGIEPTYYLSKQLKIPYYSGPFIVDVSWNTYRWGFWVFHGRTGSQTKGGKINAAGHSVRFTDDLQFYITGHSHDPIANSETRLVRDPVNCRLIEKTYWVIIAPSFMSWMDTYAYKRGYAPSGKGGVACVLYPNGSYRADFTP